jgi:uncharacterized membrane protein (DUF4010 family)
MYQGLTLVILLAQALQLQTMCVQNPMQTLVQLAALVELALHQRQCQWRMPCHLRMLWRQVVGVLLVVGDGRVGVVLPVVLAGMIEAYPLHGLITRKHADNQFKFWFSEAFYMLRKTKT